jgi:type VI secretion system protein
MIFKLTVKGGGEHSPRSIEVDLQSMTIGRAPDCTVVLNDSQRGISRVQARIEERSGEYVLIDAGSNPTLLNDRVMDEPREARLQDGDRLRMGAYTLEVSIEAAGEWDDGRYETLMTHVPAELPTPAVALPATPEWDVRPGMPLIPDDWNAPHEGLLDEAHQGMHQDLPFQPDPLAATPLLHEPAKFGVNANQELIDALGVSDPLSGRAPRPMSPVSDVRSAPNFEHVSPERVMSAAPRLRDEPLRAPLNEPLGEPAPLTATPEKPPVRQEQPPAATRADHDPDATLAALIEGLGIDATRVRHVPPVELARLVGGMLREAAHGTMGALRSRSMTKRETRMAMTLIEERDNNPLKFFPDVDTALTQMLSSRGAGYLAPEDALRAAFRDIQAHELAVVAGMRAALAHAMARIDPAEIEKSLATATKLDALLGNRRARLWQRFVDTWQHVARDTGDDFQRTFGEPFSRAYQAQLDALHPSGD